MKCKGILKKYDNQELSPSSIEHTVFDDRISSLILDFVDIARGDVEIVVSKGKISIRQID